jgi:CO/xanthine dehydrogenase FAD-binding subunit
MSYRKGNSRARYATALYAAAIAALITACSRTDVAVEQPAARPAVIHLSESTNTADTADMPEVVVSAKREKAIG